jgi:signal peptidase
MTMTLDGEPPAVVGSEGERPRSQMETPGRVIPVREVPKARIRFVSGARHGARFVAKAWLALGCTLGAIAIGPLSWGWSAASVAGRSMEPAVRRGDVVVAAPLARRQNRAAVRAGEVVLVRRHRDRGALLTHRVVAVRADGSVITRGDANTADDTSAVPEDEIVGVVRWVVPFVGHLALLADSPQPLDLTIAAGTLLALIGAAPTRRDRNRHRA